MSQDPQPSPELNRAVAIRYEQNEQAPQVVAKGKGEIADEIIRRAQENNVFIHESRELVSLLIDVDIDARIPPALYTAVAEILAWVYQQDERLSLKLQQTKSPDAVTQDEKKEEHSDSS